MERKDAFHTDTIGYLSDRESAFVCTSLFPDDGPFKDLNSFLVSLGDFHMNFHFIARSERDDFFFHVILFDQIQQSHLYWRKSPGKAHLFY